ncbi:hypothetical protein CSB09_02570 [Candidatus Gracilibacteria bacterium]|nr:MAG: hypothetical protein CSB09_02570 [Candidatus Gracilibacteria bacterium]
MHIILVGIQGSGKGTQAREIREHNPNYDFFEMGQKLRDFSQMDEELSPKVRESLEKGELISDDIIEAMLRHYAKNHSEKTIVFDGIPRTLSQLDVMEKVFPEYFVIFLDLDKEEAIKRLANRRVDPVTGRSFPADFEGEFSPFTGNKLIKRDDDNEEAVLKRIAGFYHNTLPLITEWAARGKRVYRVDAGKDIDEVYDMIEAILSAYNGYDGVS